LKDFEIWKEWKNNQLTIKEMNNKHFDNGWKNVIFVTQLNTLGICEFESR
jgi:hypothetical protein